MSDFEFTVEGPVATFLLNRPHARNAFSADISQGLLNALERIESDQSVRALIITGSGGVFCSGGDIKAMSSSTGVITPDERRTRMKRSHRIINLLASLDRPIIAAVDGPAFGAGFSLALWADMVIATPSARFCMAFARVGLIPDYGAMYTLPRIVGLSRAKEIMLSAREIDAEEAKTLGIVLEITTAKNLLLRAQSIAQSLTTASPLAISLTKSGLNSSFGSDLTTMLEIEATGQGMAGTSEYAKESFKRFTEREPLRFTWPKLESTDTRNYK